MTCCLPNMLMIWQRECVQWINGYALLQFRPGLSKGSVRTRMPQNIENNRAFQPAHSRRMPECVCVTERPRVKSILQLKAVAVNLLTFCLHGLSTVPLHPRREPQHFNWSSKINDKKQATRRLILTAISISSELSLVWMAVNPPSSPNFTTKKTKRKTQKSNKIDIDVYGQMW